MAGIEGRDDVERINIKPQVDEFKFPDGHSIIVREISDVVGVQKTFITERPAEGLESGLHRF